MNLAFLREVLADKDSAAEATKIAREMTRRTFAEHPLHYATLPARQISDRSRARRTAIISTVALFTLAILGAIGLAYTARFLGL